MSPSHRPIRQNLFASSTDGAAFGGMVGIGESYVAAFALALGLGELVSGLVASLPVLAGGFMQLISLPAVRWIGSERRWILFCASVQAISFLPFVVAALVGSMPVLAVFGVASIYWGAGLATGPAWSVWIESMIPHEVRVRYFARRSRLTQLSTMFGFILGGLALSFMESRGEVLRGFAIMFASALLMRLLSVYWLSKHVSLERSHRDAGQAAPTGALPDAEFSPMSKQGKRLIIFLVALQGCVQLSGPFFTPFMLKELHLTYSAYVGLIAVSFVTKAMSLSVWANIAKRTSAGTLLWIGSVGIVPLASLWIVSSNYYWLMSVQLLSGWLWAAYELGFFLMFFEVLPKNRRVQMLTVYNFANSAAIFVGAIGGALILWLSGAGVIGYWTLFGLSSLGRLLCLGILASAGLAAVPVIGISVRVLGIRVGNASLDAPVLPSLNDATNTR